MSEEYKLVPTDPVKALDMGWAYLDAAREAEPGRDWAFSHPGYRAMLAAAPVAPDLGEPYYYYADCGDSDYSCLCNNHSDALTQVVDHGGKVVKLWNTQPGYKVAQLEARIAALQLLLNTADQRNADLQRALSGVLFEFDDGVNGGCDERVPALDYARTICKAVEFSAGRGDVDGSADDDEDADVFDEQNLDDREPRT